MMCISIRLRRGNSSWPLAGGVPMFSLTTGDINLLLWGTRIILSLTIKLQQPWIPPNKPQNRTVAITQLLVQLRLLVFTSKESFVYDGLAHLTAEQHQGGLTISRPPIPPFLEQHPHNFCNYPITSTRWAVTAVLI